MTVGPGISHRVEPLPPGPAAHAVRPPIRKAAWLGAFATLAALAGVAMTAGLLSRAGPAPSTPTSAQSLTARTSAPPAGETGPPVVPRTGNTGP